MHDLVVIGAGPGGYAAAIRAAQLGMRVACVELEPLLGGTCLRVGCIPSKAFLESSHRYHQVREGLSAHGIKVKEVTFDLKVMLRRKSQIIATLGKGIEALFKKNGVERFSGTGRLAGTGRVEVHGSKGNEELQATHILIATGSRSAPLAGVVPDGDRIGTSTEALAYPTVPGHLVVIGAGYIGLELGSVWRRLGARVTVLEYLDRILPGMDAELASAAEKIFRRQGLEIRLRSQVTAADAVEDGCLVKCADGSEIACDRLLLAVGRIPNTDDLGLESVGIQCDERGRIAVMDHFKTSAAGVYAIGDVIQGPMLAHKAEEEGVALAEFLANGAGHVDYDTIPGVVYTHPELAVVGRTEEELQAAGIPYSRGRFAFRANGRARAQGETEGLVKVLAHEETDRILGVHILGPQAGEMINEAATAMAFGASSEDLARSCHAHPTLGEALREAAMAVTGRAIHS